MVSCEHKAQTFGAIGSIQDCQGNNVSTGPISRFAYTGREFDPETGNYYYRARHYDPQSGRFLSQDPIGFAAGDMNLYRYVGNATPNFTDPSGLRAAGHRTVDVPLGQTGPTGPVRHNNGSSQPQGSLPGFTPQEDDSSHLNVRTNGFGDPTLTITPPGPIGGPIMITEPYPTGPGATTEPIRPWPDLPGISQPGDVQIPGEGSPADYLELIPGIGDVGGMICSVFRGDGEGVVLAAVPFVPTSVLKRIKQGVHKLYQGSDGKIPEIIIKHLWNHNHIDEFDIGERIHKIKFDNGKCASDNVLIHLSGDAYDEKTGEFLGSLTQGGGSRGKR